MEFLPVPDPEFCRRLREFDPSLQLNFDPAHGVWAIWCKDPYTGSIDHVMSVVNHDGSYRELDGHVFNVLRMNRFYQQHPELLTNKVVDSLENDLEKSENRSKENARLLSKDKTLQNEFDAIVDRLRAVPLSDFLRPVVAKDLNGNPIRINKNNDGTGGEFLYRYKPDSDLLTHGTRVLMEEFNK